MTCQEPLCAARAQQLDRLLAKVDTHLLAAARMRIRELEETIERQNRNGQLSGPAKEIIRDLALIDPRCNDDTMACFFCFERDGHRQDCIWYRAAVRVDKQRKQAS